MSKHSLKALVMTVVLTGLVGASPSVASAGGNHDTENHRSLSWEAARDWVEGWLEAVMISITSTQQQESFPNVDPNGLRFPNVDPNGESFPDGDPNGEQTPYDDPSGDPVCASGSCPERFPNVDPNG